eukprot:6010967-Heterocapsa_arctica.AAC.2
MPGRAGWASAHTGYGGAGPVQPLAKVATATGAAGKTPRQPLHPGGPCDVDGRPLHAAHRPHRGMELYLVFIDANATPRFAAHSGCSSSSSSTCRRTSRRGRLRASHRLNAESLLCRPRGGRERPPEPRSGLPA